MVRYEKRFTIQGVLLLLFFFLILSSITVLLLVLPKQTLATSSSPSYDYCVSGEGSTADFSCTLESEVSNLEGFGSFEEWCTDTVEGDAGIYYQSSDTTSWNKYCVPSCCCDGETLINDSWSQQFCTNQDGSYKTADGNCDGVCGVTYKLSGIISDTDGNPVVGAFITSDNSSQSTQSDDQGQYVLSLTQGKHSINIFKSGCQQSSQSVTISDSDINGDFTLTCSGSCESPGITGTIAIPVAQNPVVSIKWDKSFCSKKARVYRCEMADYSGFKESDCLNGESGERYIGETTSNSFEDDDAIIADPSNSVRYQRPQRVCYFVKEMVVNSTSGELEETPPVVDADHSHCVFAMDEECTDGSVSGTPTCFNNKNIQPFFSTDDGTLRDPSPFTGSAYCDADNLLQGDEKCISPENCIYKNNGNTVSTECGDPSECDKCNGPFGLFVNDLAQVIGDESTSCQKLPQCVKNNWVSVADTYGSCGYVDSCVDYETEEACTQTKSYPTGTFDSCKTTLGGCNWTSNPTLGALGGGVCTPKSTNIPGVCSDCGSDCNEWKCTHIDSDCYFKNKTKECVSKSDLTCQDYGSSREDCIGASGTSVVVDALYDQSGVRLNGTNQVITRSDDKAGLGLCYWASYSSDPSDANGFCIKDANGFHQQQSDGVHDDCSEGNSNLNGASLKKCLHDFEPPVTKFPLKNGDVISDTSLRATKFRVTDNLYSSLDISTRFCVVPHNSSTPTSTNPSCYPDKALSNSVSDTPPQSGADYDLCYYSEDPAKNLEPVRCVTLKIYPGSEAELISAEVLK